MDGAARFADSLGGADPLPHGPPPAAFMLTANSIPSTPFATTSGERASGHFDLTLILVLGAYCRYLPRCFARTFVCRESSVVAVATVALGIRKLQAPRYHKWPHDTRAHWLSQEVYTGYAVCITAAAGGDPGHLISGSLGLARVPCAHLACLGSPLACVALGAR